ncbi:BVES [Lepeophtheirus salmonis]|uniref:BVES n=1 Tax=Lepeophtheirus salmonis TaxID=72036 RepID=A0A7R8CDW1_LEPSM|nr:BVES [Lepeophtheirus salmonis]CAF2779995.1 BVES [Lepeophtheirus salmonis]
MTFSPQDDKDLLMRKTSPSCHHLSGARRKGFLNYFDLGSSMKTGGPYRAAQDLLFHFSYGLFALSYLSPNSRYGRLLLHAGLVAGFLVCSSWAWNVLCAPEIFGWNFSFILLNIGQLLYILYQMRPIKFPEEIENLYLSLFAPLRSFTQGSAMQSKTSQKTVRLAVLLQGRVHVVNENNYLHDIRPNEFLDSPEYESSGINCEETFKVTVLAAVPSKILVWQRSSLEYLFIKDPYLGSKLKNTKGSSLDIRLPGIAGRLSKLNDKELSELVELNRKRDKSDEKAKKSFVKSFRQEEGCCSIGTIIEKKERRGEGGDNDDSTFRQASRSQYCNTNC